MPPNAAFAEARALLLRHRADYDAAYRAFEWPVLDRFNWALDWFDSFAQNNDARALWLIEDDHQGGLYRLTPK